MRKPVSSSLAIAVYAWQSISPFASQAWESCAQRVGGLCERLGQASSLAHSRLRAVLAVGINSWFLHGLYYLFTHRFPTLFQPFLPLFGGKFSTLSTAPTITTTTYINNVMKG